MSKEIKIYCTLYRYSLKLLSIERVQFAISADDHLPSPWEGESQAWCAQLIWVNDIAALAAGETHLITEGLTKLELNTDCADWFRSPKFSVLSAFSLSSTSVRSFGFYHDLKLCVKLIIMVEFCFTKYCDYKWYFEHVRQRRIFVIL